MAGIAGIYCADGRPADVAELKAMAAATPERGVDGVTYWNSGQVAFAHLQFCTTPESLQERQPRVAAGGDVYLVWNGRVDNREELRDALAAKSAVPVDETDPGFVLAAYLQWGPECLQRMIGDFALAVWDGRQRRLWCARDYVGIRPFYYFWDGKTFLFGPEIRALLAHPLVSLKINEGMAGEYLSDHFVSRDETLYADIRRLPSGSTLMIDSGGLRIDNWWNPELSLIDYKTDEEYGDHFRVLFDQAVRAQLRCNTKVGVALSGGLDSSSIAVTAQHLLGQRGETDRLWTFSVVGPGKAWDESEDIEAIVRHGGLNSELLEPLSPGLDHFRERAARWREFPGALNGEPMTIPMFNAAARHSVRVLSAGIGGDEWLEGRREHVVDLAAAGAIFPMLRRAREDCNFYCGIGSWRTYLAHELLRAAAPGWALARRRKRRLAREGIFSEPFQRRTNLGDRLYESRFESRRFATRVQEFTFRNISGGQEAFSLESNDRDNAGSGIEMRFPFHNRQLAEFCLRLPEEQHKQGAAAKWILRTAMGERLPTRIQRKEGKAEFSDMYATVIHEPQARARLENLTILRHTDWLESGRFVKWSRLPSEPQESYAVRYGLLWMVLGMDLWLENVLAMSGNRGSAGERTEKFARLRSVKTSY
ncbi:MAG: asparagine synthase-related protein [Acidobacteriaceae bacterium]